MFNILKEKSKLKKLKKLNLKNHFIIKDLILP